MKILPKGRKFMLILGGDEYFEILMIISDSLVKITEFKTMGKVPCSMMLKDKLLTVNFFKDYTRIFKFYDDFSCNVVKETTQKFFHWYQEDCAYLKKNVYVGISWPYPHNVMKENFINSKALIIKQKNIILGLKCQTKLKEIVYTSNRNSVGIINLLSFKRKRKQHISNRYKINGFKFSKNEKILFIFKESFIIIINYYNWEILQTFKDPGSINSFGVKESNSWIYWGSDNNSINIANLNFAVRNVLLKP